MVLIFIVQNKYIDLYIYGFGIDIAQESLSLVKVL